jgi:hypothetical protein
LAATRAYFEAKGKEIDDQMMDALKDNPETSPGYYLGMKLAYLKEKTTDGAQFDIKAPGHEYDPAVLGSRWATYNKEAWRFDDFGNYNFGVAANALGVPLELAKFGAGLNQIGKGQGDITNPKGYFDEKRDTQKIIQGYNHKFK